MPALGCRKRLEYEKKTTSDNMAPWPLAVQQLSISFYGHVHGRAATDITTESLPTGPRAPRSPDEPGPVRAQGTGCRGLPGSEGCWRPGHAEPGERPGPAVVAVATRRLRASTRRTRVQFSALLTRIAPPAGVGGGPCGRPAPGQRPAGSGSAGGGPPLTVRPCLVSTGRRSARGCWWPPSERSCSQITPAASAGAPQARELVEDGSQSEGHAQ